MSENQNMVSEVNMSVEELRQKFTSVELLYNFVAKKLKIFIPKWPRTRQRPKCLTEEYLISIIQGKTFTIQKEVIKEPPEIIVQNISKGELEEEILKLIDKPLNFKFGKEPPKDWYEKVLYSLKPDHPIFVSIENTINRIIPKE